MKRWTFWLGMMAAAAVAQDVEELTGPPKRLAPAEVLSELYAPERMAGFVFDPQELLPVKERTAREEFLAYHASDSALDLRLVLMDEGQPLPAGFDGEAYAELAGDERAGVALVYFMGEPERAMLFRNARVEGEGLEVLAVRMLRGAVDAARAEPSRFQALEEFLVQASVGAFWLEEAMMERPEAAVVPEVAAEPEVPEVPEWVEELREKAWMAALAGVVLAGGLAAVWVWRARRRYEFPLAEVRPRLGGAHGAGIGAVISFGSTTQSASAQREPERDYLGGI